MSVTVSEAPRTRKASVWGKVFSNFKFKPEDEVPRVNVVERQSSLMSDDGHSDEKSSAHTIEKEEIASLFHYQLNANEPITDAKRAYSFAWSDTFRRPSATPSNHSDHDPKTLKVPSVSAPSGRRGSWFQSSNPDPDNLTPEPGDDTDPLRKLSIATAGSDSGAGSGTNSRRQSYTPRYAAANFLNTVTKIDERGAIQTTPDGRRVSLAEVRPPSLDSRRASVAAIPDVPQRSIDGAWTSGADNDRRMSVDSYKQKIDERKESIQLRKQSDATAAKAKRPSIADGGRQLSKPPARTTFGIKDVRPQAIDPIASVSGPATRRPSYTPRSALSGFLRSTTPMSGDNETERKSSRSASVGHSRSSVSGAANSDASAAPYKPTLESSTVTEMSTQESSPKKSSEPTKQSRKLKTASKKRRGSREVLEHHRMQSLSGIANIDEIPEEMSPNLARSPKASKSPKAPAVAVPSSKSTKAPTTPVKNVPSFTFQPSTPNQTPLLERSQPQYPEQGSESPTTRRSATSKSPKSSTTKSPKSSSTKPPTMKSPKVAQKLIDIDDADESPRLGNVHMNPSSTFSVDESLKNRKSTDGPVLDAATESALEMLGFRGAVSA